MTRCMWHLPGNRQCTYGALYVLTWEAPPRPTGAALLHRPVCVVHLAPALDEALTRPEVRVTLVPPICEHAFLLARNQKSKECQLCGELRAVSG